MFSIRSILLLTIVSCVVIMTNQANASTSLMVITPVSKSARRLYLDSRSLSDRRLKITMPKKICSPAASAGAFIVEQAIDCAIKYLTAGISADKVAKFAGVATKTVEKGVAVGKAAGKKLGLFDLINQKKHELAVFVMKKLLGALGCPNKRRLGFFKKIGKGFTKATKVVASGVKKTVDNGAKGVKKTVDNGAKGVKRTVSNGALGVKKTAENAAKGVKKTTENAAKDVKKTTENAAKDVKKTAVTVAKDIKKTAEKVAKETKKQIAVVGKAAKQMENVAKSLAKDVGKATKVAEKFAKEHGAVILKVACVVVAKTCKPACAVAVQGVVAAGAYFGIPLQCLSGALEKGCWELCKVICGKRRLMIRRSAKF